MLRALLAPALLLLAGAGTAQEIPQLDLDYATFLYDADQTLVEVYLSVGATSLAYAPSEEGPFVAELPLQLTVRPVSGSAPEGASDTPVLDQAVPLRFAVADTSALDGGQFFVEQLRFALAPGEYALDVTAAAAANAGRPEVRLSLDLPVPDYADSESVMVSGVTLASGLERDPEASDHRFYKNGLVITPNPNALYGEGQGRLYYYAETYGLTDEVPAGEYTLLTYLSESNLPQPMEDQQRRTSRAVRSPDVLVGAFDISELPSGSYFLRFALLDENNEALAEQSKKFFVFNPGVERPQVAVDEGFEMSLYAVMGEEELDMNLAHVRVIATQQELGEMRRLTDRDAQRRYLAQFWQSRDTDADPSVNAARRDFYERLRYAEERYDTPFEEAWETDRGRVLLKYGYPSQVDPQPFSADQVPHEVWTYDNLPGQGQAIFVFADREGLSRYDLIHSTVSGEVSAPNWQSMLRR